MANFAQADLIGHLGKDPEIKYLPSGEQVASFSLPTSRKVKEEEITTWWRCTVWGKPAEVIQQYVSKGDPIQVSGEPMLRPYTDRDGIGRVSLELTVHRFTLLGARKDAPVAHPSQATRAPNGQSGNPGQAQQAASAAMQAPSGGQPFDDDIPFDVWQRGMLA
jgi:single-strand DNA-binding protein